VTKSRFHVFVNHFHLLLVQIVRLIAVARRRRWTCAPQDTVMTGQQPGVVILKRFLPILIVAAMILGVLAGFLINTNLSPDGAKAAAANLSIITDIFLRLIRMIIAPLVFSTLVVGIAHMEDSAAIGRVGDAGLVHAGVAGVADPGLDHGASAASGNGPCPRPPHQPTWPPAASR
jgi:hypothetical protein